MTNFRKIYIGVDPAVGEEQRHDCTAIVAGMLFSEKVADRYINKVYILPKFINKRMDFGTAIDAMLKMHEHIKQTYNATDSQIKVLIENGGQQKAFYDQLSKECSFPPKYIEQVGTKGVDKRSRIAAACSFLQSKRVWLPKTGMEELVNQLLYFGAEKHDDLADAFAMVVNEAMADKPKEMGVIAGDYYPKESKNQKQFFAHGQMHYGDQEEYYRRIQRMIDKQDEYLNGML